MAFSNNKSKQELFSEIQNALAAVDYGSVDIIVQDGRVTQISVRNIKKTSLNISNDEDRKYISVDTSSVSRKLPKS